MTAAPAAVGLRERPLTLAGGRLVVLYRPRSVLTCVVLLAATLAVAVVSLGTGEYPVPPGEVVRALLGRADADATWVVTTLRLPRAVAAILVGAALGVAGGIVQGVARNPLASPDIVGFTTGSATGALLQILVLGGGPVAIASGAVGGGLATAALVIALTWRAGADGYRLILVGVGVGAILVSVNAYLLTRADAGAALSAAVWLTGSLNVRTWDYVVPLAAALAVLLPVAAALARPLRTMELGDDTATGLGVAVGRIRPLLVAVAVALTGAAVATAGPIGFVALAAPQLARRLARTPGVAPAPAACMGALLVVASDLVAQRLLAPVLLPVGIVTAGLGGGYLVFLLVSEWRRRRG